MTVAQPAGRWDGPTLNLSAMLGDRLRILREASGISREAAGRSIRGSESKINHLELGRLGFHQQELARLLELYGVTRDVNRVAWLAGPRRATAPHWWQRYDDVTPRWFRSYLELEAAAQLIRTYEVQFVPGLLQTPEYARAVIRLVHSGAEVDRRVRLRMDRQRLLRRADAPRIWMVLDEAALRRPIGGRAVMRRQIEALIEAAELPNLHLQVLPLSAGGHAAAGGAFTILRFPDAELRDVVYTEQLTTALFLDSPDDGDLYLEAMGKLCIEAEPPERTIGLLCRLRDELDAPRRRAAVTVPVEVYLDTDDVELAATVFQQVDEVSDLLGFDGPLDPRVYRGSIWRRAWAVARSGDDGGGAACGHRDADSLRAMEATTRLLKTLEAVPRASIFLPGGMLIVKYPDADGPVLHVRRLSSAETEVLLGRPEILRHPEQVLTLLMREAGEDAYPREVNGHRCVTFSGITKLKVCQRLIDGWVDVADVLDISLSDRTKFKEARSLWEFLEVRGRLGELRPAFATIGRHDLIDVLDADRSGRA
jgi:transcriptional regulator with XRE-family HTH domain